MSSVFLSLLTACAVLVHFSVGNCDHAHIGFSFHEFVEKHEHLHHVGLPEHCHSHGYELEHGTEQNPATPQPPHNHELDCVAVPTTVNANQSLQLLSTDISQSCQPWNIVASVQLIKFAREPHLAVRSSKFVEQRTILISLHFLS